MEAYKEKLTQESQQISRQNVLQEQASSRIRNLEDEKNHFESKVHKLEAEINSCELSREGLKRDKTTVRSKFIFSLIINFHMFPVRRYERLSQLFKSLNNHYLITT